MRGEFPTSIVINSQTYTITPAPDWVKHKLRFFVNRNGGTNFDSGQNVCKAERKMVGDLCARFGT
jgi:hypothetical protein